MTRRTVFFLFIAVFLTSVFLVSCGRLALYQGLAEEDANEMLVLLAQNGIKASKKKDIVQNEISYSIEVAEKDLVKARQLLVSNNLPRRKELGLTGVYKEKGLIPTPDEQKARFLLALKGEIINSLERIPQIVDVDVVLNIPTKDEFADAATRHEQRPTAAVVVRAKPLAGGESPLAEAKIQEFVANAVEGLNPRDVSVVITYVPAEHSGVPLPGDVKTFSPGLPGVVKREAPQAPVFSDEIIGLRLDSDSKGKLKVYLLIFFLILIVLASALIVVIVQGSRARRAFASQQGPAGRHPAIEGRIMGQGSPPEIPGPPEDEEL